MTSDEEDVMLDDTVDLHAPDNNDFADEGRGQLGGVSAAAGSSTSGMDRVPVDRPHAAAGSSTSGMDRVPGDRPPAGRLPPAGIPAMDGRPQPDFQAIQCELSKKNTENLMKTVTPSPGKQTSDWLGRVHGLHGSDKSVSIQLPDGPVVSPSDDVTPVDKRQTDDTKSDATLLDLGLAEHLSDDLICQIQSGKFVELHKLLPVEAADFEDDKVVTLDENESSVVVKPKDNRKKNHNFHSVVTCLVYLSCSVHR